MYKIVDTHTTFQDKFIAATLVGMAALNDMAMTWTDRITGTKPLAHAISTLVFEG